MNSQSAIEVKINPESWRSMIFWAWRDQLRHAETTPVIGESLRAGDMVVQACTYNLFKLISPLSTSTYFGRKYTLWDVENVSAPKETQSVESFYAQQTYRVLPKEGCAHDARHD